MTDDVTRYLPFIGIIPGCEEYAHNDYNSIYEACMGDAGDDPFAYVLTTEYDTMKTRLEKANAILVMDMEAVEEGQHGPTSVAIIDQQAREIAQLRTGLRDVLDLFVAPKNAREKKAEKYLRALTEKAQP